MAAISDGLAGGPGDRDMSYDALDRLAGVVAGPAQGGNGSFAYDPLDNLRVLDQGSRQFRYHYDADNRLEQIKSPTGALLHSFGYDARGNTTSKDSGTLTFDRENRLIHSALPTATTYVYDGLGRRAHEFMGASTYFYYSHEGKLLYTNDLKTSTRTDHIYLSGSLVAARKVPFGSNPSITVTYQHTDALGSPVAFSDASGNVTRRERMTAWGEPADGTWTNEPGYTGHQMDAASKLVYMQQRYYDPAIGRFLSVDPMASDMKNGWNFNRYNYAANNPYKFTDPDGRQACGSDPECIEASNFDSSRSNAHTVTQGAQEDAAATSQLPRMESRGERENGARIDVDESGSAQATRVPMTSRRDGNVIRSSMSGIGGADSVAHSHPVDTSDPSPGPDDDAAVIKGYPSNIGRDGNVIVLERVEGQFRVRILRDRNLKPSDREEIQSDVDEFQRRAQQ